MEDQGLPHRGYAHSLSSKPSGGSLTPGASAAVRSSGSFGRAAAAAITEVAAEQAVAAVDAEK